MPVENTVKNRAKFPFSISINNEQFENEIISFDKNEYDEKLNAFHNEVDLVFAGNATAKLCDVIEEKLKK